MSLTAPPVNISPTRHCFFDDLVTALGSHAALSAGCARPEVDRDTYGLFNLEPGVPTYSYELVQAVAYEYLVSFKALSVATQFSRHGIKYDDLSDAEREEYEASLTDCETGELSRHGPGHERCAFYCAWAGWTGMLIRPYFFIFLYSVTRLIPRASAARERL